MKLIFFLMALLVIATACKKDKNKDGGQYLKGKIVRTTCASLVVQVLNDDSIGDDGWKDRMNNNAQYDNVISVLNGCRLPDGWVATGHVLYFKVATPANTGCMFCELYDDPPKTQYDITHVSIE